VCIGQFAGYSGHSAGMIGQIHTQDLGFAELEVEPFEDRPEFLSVVAHHPHHPMLIGIRHGEGCDVDFGFRDFS